MGDRLATTDMGRKEGTQGPSFPLTRGKLGPHLTLVCQKVINEDYTDDRRVSLYFTMVRPFSFQNCPFIWGIWIPCNTWLILGPTGVLNPNGNSVVSTVLRGH